MKNARFGSKVTQFLSTLFHKIYKYFKHMHMGCLSKGNRREFGAVHLDFTWVECILSESSRNTKLGQKPVSEIGLFQKFFRIWLQIHSPKLKSKWTASNSSLLPLYKHPTCLCMNFFLFFNVLKIVVTFKPNYEEKISLLFKKL